MMPNFTTPAAALAALLECIAPVESEHIALAHASGRVLAQDIYADRDHPACDISAMDGYAVRVADMAGGMLPVAGKVLIGQAAVPLPAGVAFYIVTGAAIPAGADAVIRIEDIERDGDMISLRIAANSLAVGQHIRRQAENICANQPVISAGTLITPAVLAALASFGVSQAAVYCRVRVGILTTGDEVVPVNVRPEPWQIRNANAAGLQGLFASATWTQLIISKHVADDLPAMQSALQSLLDACDLVLLTGGVSMGDRDYTPAAVSACDCRPIFHKLPIRPGKPILAAVGPKGQAVLALPGNPLSVLATALRFAAPTARRLAGFSILPSPVLVRLHQPDTATIPLWWFRPFTIRADGLVELVACRGSGDVVAAARSDGFIELPPGAAALDNAAGEGPWPFYSWRF